MKEGVLSKSFNRKGEGIRILAINNIDLNIGMILSDKTVQPLNILITFSIPFFPSSPWLLTQRSAARTMFNFVIRTGDFMEKVPTVSCVKIQKNYKSAYPGSNKVVYGACEQEFEEKISKF